jgi:hypothetical protein
MQRNATQRKQINIDSTQVVPQPTQTSTIDNSFKITNKNEEQTLPQPRTTNRVYTFTQTAGTVPQKIPTTDSGMKGNGSIFLSAETNSTSNQRSAGRNHQQFGRQAWPSQKQEAQRIAAL